MIPRRVFSTLALLAVIGCLFVTFAYATSGGWPFAQIAAASGRRVLGALVTLLVGLLVSLVFIVPLRLLRDMKPITDAFSDLSLDAITRERTKLEAMRIGTPAGAGGAERHSAGSGATSVASGSSFTKRARTRAMSRLVPFERSSSHVNITGVPTSVSKSARL